MNDKSVSLTAKDILDKIFTPNVKGYDPDEVDDFLDQIVRDYQAYDKYIQDAQAYIQSLETQLRRAKEDNHEQSISLAKAENRVKGIKDTDQVNSTNAQLLQYIDRLEKALYARGVDPKKLQKTIYPTWMAAPKGEESPCSHRL